MPCCIAAKAKREHWRGFQGILVREAAPTLVFGYSVFAVFFRLIASTPAITNAAPAI
jgi:hypothetical protein